MKLEISMAKLIEDKEKNRYTYKLFVKNIEGELEEFVYQCIKRLLPQNRRTICFRDVEKRKKAIKEI